MFNYSGKDSKDKIFYNQKGKVIGKLIDQTLEKRVKGSVHKLKTPPGWAWDKNVIDEAERLGGKRVVITDSETNTTFTAKLSDFRKYGILINRGFGNQIVLPIAYWSTDEEENFQIRLF